MQRSICRGRSRRGFSSKRTNGQGNQGTAPGCSLNPKPQLKLTERVLFLGVVVQNSSVHRIAELHVEKQGKGSSTVGTRVSNCDQADSTVTSDM